MRAVAAYYDQGIRVMKVAGHFGEPFFVANGIGQGDPLSMRFINGAGHMWVTAMKVNFADLRLGVYVDDRSIRARTRGDLEGALGMTHELDDCIGQELNITKSYGMATSRKSRRLLRGVRVGTSSVRYTNDARSLGAHIVTTKTKRASMARVRADKAVSALKRVKASLYQGRTEGSCLLRWG